MAKAKVYRVPPVRSPLEFGRWYTKPAFEKQYRVRIWPYVVSFFYDQQRVRCSAAAVINLLQQHAAAYFQLLWNARPYLGTQEVRVRSGKRQRWMPYPRLYAPGTTIRLRICYALAPQRDTEVILYDGYGLPTRETWWQQAATTRIVLAPSLERAA